MQTDDKNRKINWGMLIPIIFWIVCISLSTAKLFQTGNKIHVIDILDVFNSNTFSTYISMIICMLYQFFSEKNIKKQEKSGLSRKGIALTIISTCAYAVMEVVNACRYNIGTTIITTIFSVTYVVLFFRYMRTRQS